MPSGTFVVLPTYNERENIELMVNRLMDLPVDLRVVVIDDNSPDGTGESADRLAATFPERVFVVHRAGKLGLGTAYRTGFDFALRQDAERIMTMDADFSHDPEYIPAMIEKSKAGYDLVIGSRYVEGGDAPDFPLRRKILSGGANGFAKTLLNLKAHDVTAGFRCYQRHVLESLPLDSILSNGYSFLVEMLFLVQRAGFTVGEVPIIFLDRTRGKSKISREEIYKAVYTVLRLAMRRLFDRSHVQPEDQPA